MKDFLKAKVNLEILNPAIYEERFPTGKGQVLGENVEECIEEAKNIYTDERTRPISLEVAINGKLETIEIK